MKKFRVAYCGTPDFSVPTLDLLANHPHIDLVMVISMPVAQQDVAWNLNHLKSLNTPKQKDSIFQCENINKEEEFLTKLTDLNLDFMVVLAFCSVSWIKGFKRT